MRRQEEVAKLVPDREAFALGATRTGQEYRPVRLVLVHDDGGFVGGRIDFLDLVNVELSSHSLDIEGQWKIGGKLVDAGGKPYW